MKKICPYKQKIELFLKSLKVVPEREYKFHETRKWRVDWAFPALKIAIEYEGMAFHGGKSRHTTISGFSNDAEKYNELSLHEWLLLRFNAKHVESGLAFNHIERILSNATK